MKRIYAALFSVGLAFSASAEVQDMIYTYANDDLGYWGKGKAETIDVAMRINNPGLVGKQITSVTTLINATEGISNVSIWLTKELKLENKVNVPDIVSVSVTPVSSEYNGVEGVGVLTATFAEPYELTEEPVYVGYSLTVDAATDNKTKYPLLLSSAQNDEGLYLHMTRSVLKWKNYFPTLGAVAPIYVTLTGEFPEYAVSIGSINEAYAEVGQPYSAVASLSNVGTATIESLEYSYEVGGQTKKGSVNLDVPVTPDLVNSKNVDLVFEGIDELGDTEVTVTLDKVNGQPNTILSPVTFATYVKPFVPVSRPLVEEYTGTWCGWCTRGWLALELIREWYPDSAVAIAYHSGDPMEVTNSFAVSVSGFPSATINRGAVIDPYYGTDNGSNDFGIHFDLEAAMAVFAPADINVEAVYSEDGQSIDVKSYSRFVYSYEETPYKVGYVLVADGLTDPSWRQTNSYAQYKDNPTYAGTYLETICNWPASVSNLVFNDVAIDVNGMKGVNNSLPASVESGVIYENDYTYDISGNKLVRDGSTLYVVAFLMDKNGRIVNSNKTAIASYVGVGETVNEIVQPVSTVYYDLMGRRVDQPSNGLFIEVQKMIDGTQISHKVMKK